MLFLFRTDDVVFVDVKVDVFVHDGVYVLVVVAVGADVDGVLVVAVNVAAVIVVVGVDVVGVVIVAVAVVVVGVCCWYCC